MSNEDTVLKEVYSSFKERLSFGDFQSKLNSLTIEYKWNFVRATRLYQQALKCKECNPTIAIVLLCSCADAIKFVKTGKPQKKHYGVLSELLSKNTKNITDSTNEVSYSAIFTNRI